MTPLSPAEAQRIGQILDASPGKLARTIGCTAAQARGLQHYLVLVFVGAYRRGRGEPWQDVQMRAAAVLRTLAPHIRTAIIASLAA